MKVSCGEGRVDVGLQAGSTPLYTSPRLLRTPLSDETTWSETPGSGRIILEQSSNTEDSTPVAGTIQQVRIHYIYHIFTVAVGPTYPRE